MPDFEVDSAGLRSVCEALADVGVPDTMSATEAVYWLAARAAKASAEALREAADDLNPESYPGDTSWHGDGFSEGLARAADELRGRADAIATAKASNA